MKKLLIISCLFLASSSNAQVRPNTKTTVSPAQVAVLYALQEKAWNDFKMSMLSVKQIKKTFALLKRNFKTRKKTV